MASNVEKVELGPAIVEYGDGADKVVFETTIGGVNLKVETSYRDQKIDQFGETVVSKKITGRNATVEVPFAEYDLTVIPKIMVGAEVVTGTDSKSKVLIKTAVGMDLIKKAKKVVIKPLAHVDNPDMWVTLPQAFPETDLEYAYDNDKERITKITLRSTPDADKVIVIMGDEEVTSI